jgi:hypothetical protein
MILYKYFPCNTNTFKSLAVQGLWCHYPFKMNDPFECLSTVERKFNDNKINDFREHINNIKINNEVLNEIQKSDNTIIEKFINKQRSSLIKKLAFCSLSEVKDSILMWSHYANSHYGIVIGFEFNDLKDDYHFQKIDYIDELPDFDLIKFADFLNGKDEYIAELIKDISVKSLAWAEEKEWRIWRREPAVF